ncbi:hypothetical protein CEXT_799261 [Caerostris extrusa]|uniref:Uncharacterized protein n=1 Tax=Caerostris extrusa TaxID=172846 RepID=A0AAV4XWQ0_CAEEX|nr:hypothetical protein CEXT_799261 [Caerostris extrusa]
MHHHRNFPATQPLQIQPELFFLSHNKQDLVLTKFVESVDAGFVGDELEEAAEEIPGGFVADDNTGFFEDGLTGFVEDDLALDIVEYCDNLFEMTILIVGLLNHVTFMITFLAMLLLHLKSSHTYLNCSASILKMTKSNCLKLKLN